MPRHIVAVAYEAWGHNRALGSLAAKIVQSSPDTFVTLFTPERLHDQVQNEVSRNFTNGDVETSSRIVVVGLDLGPPQGFDIFVVDGAFSAIWSKFAQLQPIKCGKTGKEIVAPSKPDAIIIDIFGLSILHHVRSDAQQRGVPPPKTIAWVSCSVATVWNFVEHNDEMTEEALARKAKELGKSFDDVTDDFATPHGAVIKVPGQLPVYDYENFPQKPLFPGIKTGKFLYNVGRVLDEADQVICASSKSYETPEMVAYCAEHSKEKGQGYFYLGPLIPFGEKSLDIERERADPSRESTEFLERILKSFGPQSLTYISFGSVWWPPEAEKVWAFLETLVEIKRPFIMSHASPFAQIPEWVTKLVRESGIGYLCNWAPQQAILNHPATGWFVTHAGFNSVFESISAGIPMICWPFQADQPLNTRHVTHHLGIAYELVSVRSEHLDKPLYATGQPPKASLADVREETIRVFGDAYGDDGASKRKKLGAVRDEIKGAWGEDGSSKRDLLALLAAI